MGTWIEILSVFTVDFQVMGRSLRGNVDRNGTKRWLKKKEPCRSLRGNVDRNILLGLTDYSFPVVPYVGTWIEILKGELYEY